MIQVVGADAPPRQAHAPMENKLQENERKTNASFAAKPLGESTQFFFDIQKFSFYTLNRNCYSSNGDLCTLFSPFRSAQRQHISLILFYERLFLLVFSILSFSAMKYSSRIFSLNFSPFLRVLYFCNRFFYLLMMIFSKMIVRRVLVRYKLRIRVRMREKNRK